jgi:hypothetical protein
MVDQEKEEEKFLNFGQMMVKRENLWVNVRNGH